MTNVTISDLFRILAGFALFTPFALFPGYVVGALSNGLRFRERSVAEKLSIAAPLSFACVPLLIYLTGRAGGMPAAWAFIGLSAAAFAALFARDVRRESHPFAGGRGPLLAAFSWIALAIVILIDLQWNGRLYIAAASFDYAIRNDIINSITRTGMVPTNPFFFPGHAVALRYHYFFFIPCSMVEALSGGWVSPGASLAAATLWCGLALMCLVFVYVRFFRSTEAIPSRRNAWTGIGMLPVIGLDVIPTSLLIAMGVIFFTVDKWNEDLVGWLDSLMWAPHYVAAAIGCLMGFLLVWTAVPRNRTASVTASVTAGAAFAGAAGTGIYIALVFAAGIAAYIGVSLWKRWWNDVKYFLLAGAAAAILALPYLSALSVTGGSNTGPAFVYPTVRSFRLADNLLRAVHLNGMIPTVNFALLPLNYALELGVLFLVGIVQARRYVRRRAPLGRKEWAGIVLIAAPVLICSFWRSGVIANNDLGWRGFLIPQFVLLLWAIGPVRASRRRWSRRATKKRWSGLFRMRPWVTAGVWLGLAGAVLGAVMDRGYVAGVDWGIVKTRNWLVPDQSMAVRLLALRETYEWIGHNTPTAAMVLPSPDFPDIAFGLYARRPTLAFDRSCGTSFGGSMDECGKLLVSLLPLFDGSQSEPNTGMDYVCGRFPLRMVVIKDTDPVWRNSQSWVWKWKPVYDNRFSRVFACP